MVAVMDRSATTWSVLNGLTINCVQCHSHPYDPIRHAEYYKSLGILQHHSGCGPSRRHPCSARSKG